MKSLILTVLYLAKDTLHRWKTRVSSPLSRMLVVFFLSMCSLCFMANYVLSTKMVFDEIADAGADTARISILPMGRGMPCLPDIAFLEREFDCDALILLSAGISVQVKDKWYPVMCYPVSSVSRLASVLPRRGNAVLLLPEEKDKEFVETPVTVTVERRMIDIPCRRLPENHLLERVYGKGVVLIDASAAMVSGHANGALLILKQKRMNYLGMKRIDTYFHHFFRFEKMSPNVFAPTHLLRKMEIVQGNQAQCRAGFTIGIAVIVGILLTALASMEYRQNEYIYTLMKSFGIRPIMLVGTFIIENLLLVAISLAAAVQFFMIAQPIVLREFFRISRNYSLTLEEIMPDITLLGSALILCVFISAIPIICAVRREIGRVLQ